MKNNRELQILVFSLSNQMNIAYFEYEKVFFDNFRILGYPSILFAQCADQK